MSDPDPISDPAGPPVLEHKPAPVAAPAGRRGGTPLPLTLLLTAGLGGGLYWVWTHPQQVPGGALVQGGIGPSADPQPAIDAARAQIAAAVQGQLQALSGRVDALEKAGAPAPAPAAPAPPAITPGVSQEAFADAAKRIDDLSGRMNALSAKQDAQAAEIQTARDLAAQRQPDTAPPPPDTTAAQVPALIAGQQAADMGSRLDRQKAADNEALAQQKTVTDQALAQQKSALDELEQRLAKLEAAPSPAEALKQQQDAASAAQREQAETKTQVAAVESRVEKLEQGAGTAQGAAQGAAQNASRAIRIEAAEAALAAGQPLGTLPDAPPALARFAAAAPPTEAALRATFPQVADAARAASQPDVSQRSFLDRALARVQQSVTVRRGDHVLVGDPAAGLLARAQDALNAGDLKHAADILAGLNGPAAAAASSWVAQARSLVDARAALAAMARG